MLKFYIWLEFEQGVRVRLYAEVFVQKTDGRGNAVRQAEKIGKQIAEKMGARFSYLEDA